MGDILSGESSSDAEEEELLLANFAALFPFSRFGLYGLIEEVYWLCQDKNIFKANNSFRM